MSVRKAHNSGRNHLRNVVDYYQRESTPPRYLAFHHWQRRRRHFPQSVPRTNPSRVTEIGHEKAQSVIDSITSSYAAEGQAHANPMLPQNQPGHGAFPPPFAFPGGIPPPFPMPGMPGAPPPPLGAGGFPGMPPRKFDPSALQPIVLGQGASPSLAVRRC